MGATAALAAAAKSSAEAVPVFIFAVAMDAVEDLQASPTFQDVA